MNWKHVWELFRINLLYANPQVVTNIQKKQEKKPKAQFSPVKAMFKQQVLMLLVFSFIYTYMFIGLDFKQHPGIFTLYVLIFSLTSLLQTFTALYSTFYESKDSHVYLPLPLKASEVFIAKSLSGLMVGMTFLVPLLSLFLIAYWQLVGPLAILLAFISFGFNLFLVMVIAMVLANTIGTLISRSRRRKLYSTVLMTSSTILLLVPIMFVGFIQGYSRSDHAADLPLLPYVRGYYDLALAPLSLSTLLHLYLPLLGACLLLLWFYKVRMPRYFQEALYQTKTTKVQVKKVTHSQGQVLRRHHLSTLNNATLIVNTYLVPIFYMIMMGGGLSSLRGLTPSYFGFLFLIGLVSGCLSAQPISFLGVASSLEGPNFDFIRSLPVNVGDYLRQKFWLFYTVQVGITAFLGGLGLLFVGHLHLLLIFSFLLGFLIMTYLMGGYFFERDLRLLELNWQDVTQLFSRGRGQWLYVGLLMGNIFLGGSLAAIVLILSRLLDPLVVNSLTFIILALVLVLVYVFVDRRRWKRIRKQFLA